MPSCFCLLFDNPEQSFLMEKKMLENDIFCRKYYHPLKDTKQAMDIFNRILCLPCNVDMSFQKIYLLISIIYYPQTVPFRIVTQKLYSWIWWIY